MSTKPAAAHVPTEAGELVDLDTLKPKLIPPTEKEVQRLLDAEEYGEIEPDDRGDD